MSKIGKYLWWLLPNFLKKKGNVDPENSTCPSPKLIRQ